MKQTIRAFALGIICATVLLSITYYMTKEEVEQNQPELTDEQMISKLENNGYFISTEAPNESDKTEEKPATEIDQDQEQEAESDEDLITLQLVIEEDMSLQTVVDNLYEANMVNDPEQFIEFLEENNYTTKIQIGEFTINNEMSELEIANMITKQ